MPRQLHSNPDFLGGSGAAILVDGRDETRLNNKVALKDTRDIHKRTTFQSPGNAEELSYGNWSGLATLSGYLSESAAVVSAQLATHFGQGRISHKFLTGPSGLLVGYEAIFTRTLATDFDVELDQNGITTAGSGFATSGYGFESGLCLHAPHVPGTGELENARFSIVGTVPNTTRLGVKATAGTVIADVVTPTNNASWKAAVESLNEYRAVTVTGSVTNTGGNWVINLTFEFTGVDAGRILPPVLAMNNEVQRYVASGNGTFAGVAIVPGDAVADIEDDLQAAGGDLANITADGVSAAAWAGGDALTGATRTDAVNFADPGWSEWDRGAGAAPVTIDSYTAGYVVEGAWAEHRLYTRQNSGDAWQLLDTFTPGTWNEEQTLLRYVRLEHQGYSSGQGNGAQSQTVSFVTTSDATPAVVDLNVRFPASLGNVPPKVATGGVASTPTQGGNTLALSHVTLHPGGIQGFSYNYLTAGGNGDWVDGEIDLPGFLAIVSVLYTHNATLTVYIDHADDDEGEPGAPSVAATFTVATQPGAELLQLPKTPLKRWRRARWTLAGTNPVAVFAAAVSA